MATFVDQAYYEWAHDDVAHQDESRGVSDTQMLDHGSISFGRFAYESLSWERRSVFTHNKCQEELEKFKCPGLVAKKKAYFEEYYKRIRAMKASRENQQTELTLEYGGDESISSQNGEDELAKHTANLGEEATILVDGHAEEPVEISAEKEILEVQNRQSEELEEEDYIKFPLLVEISAEKVQEIVEVQKGHLDPNAMSINLGSLRSKSEDIELEDNAKYPLQTQQWDLEPDYKSSTRTVEVSEQHGCSNLDMEDVSWKNSIMPTEPEGDPKATELAKKVASEKVANHKAHLSVYKVKELSAKGAKAPNSEHKTNSDGVKPLRGPKYASQRTTEKSGRVAGSSKTPADKVPRKIHSFSTAPPNRPLTTVRSSVTIPRPFSFATDRRAVVSGNREGPVKSDYKASNKTTSFTVFKKDAANVQASSKKAIGSTGAQNGVLKTRCYEERKKPLPVDKQRIGLKDRGGNVPERPKTRPINIPPHNGHSSSNGTETRTKIRLREDTRKEQKSEARSSKVCQTSRKFDTRPSGNLVRATKEIFASSTGSHLIKGRKLQSGEQSLDGKKPRCRQEKPRWR